MVVEKEEKKERVCVTGAGGYLASWVVKFLLAEGYVVHATVRDPCDDKNGHLKKLEKASKNLKLFKADVLDIQGLCEAFGGCTRIFHIACPVFPPGRIPNHEVEMIEPAVSGTRNVLDACTKSSIKRVVVVSSVGAVMLNPNWPKDKAMDEECWSDTDFCNTIENYYCLAKTISEYEALEYAKRSGMSMVTLCPSIIIGPMLQSTVNATSLHLLTLLKEVEGRYICTSHVVKNKGFVDMLQTKYPNYNYPKSFTEVDEEVKLSSEKLQKLGWKYRPIEETVDDSFKSYEERGLLG
ncbi:hypothetical protein FNV43_RR08875 [Rhamnella rubrinervis]|uniref:NAD-dependent epimerase/dehydratase domain-containing protein n=1 Tax=Rhamnella rubrinervis TaxID=2594499 RepID=A0A8K0H9L2_9ROSA|nr:hypothetical protein FNV43_RR08875 [Rhamnella rubrinervis]